MMSSEELPPDLKTSPTAAIDQSSTSPDHTEIAVSSDNDDDYIVELRMPREKKTGNPKKRFQLRLKHASAESGSDSDDSVDSTKETTTEKEGSEELQRKPCTEENWREFMSYQRQNYIHGAFFAASASLFEEAPSNSTKPLILSKLADGKHELSLKSTFLQAQLRKVVDIEHYNGVAISASEIILARPFIPLFHHIEDMKTNIATNTDATDLDRAQMDALYYFTTLGMPASLYKDVRSKMSQGLVVYNELWALFRPGDFAVSKDPLGHYEIFRITSVKLEEESRPGLTIQYRWTVTLLKNTWKDGQFKRVSFRQRFETFVHARRITDLDFYPLSYHKSAQALRDDAIQAGREWKRYCEGEPIVMSHKGNALSVVKESLPPTPYGPPINDSRNYNISNLSSTVITDPLASIKAFSRAGIDGKPIIRHASVNNGGLVEALEVSDFTDEEFMLCPSSVTVFCLDDQNWYTVNVARLTPKIWKPKAFNRLVLDPEKKDALKRIASRNSQAVQAAKSVDVIEGKGKGVVLLLHGPPGVGKTLTAEVLSELTQRPLLKVNLGRVASHIKWEETLEHIFSNAEDWKAILLIDEAEIVLEKRTFERMTQNSWISVFLHKLEYYKGILILTTNLIDCIDEAFESRISYPIRFRELNRDDRRQIWTDFIKDMKMLPAYKDNLLDEVDRWSEAEINGRQIRNIIMMAENLAAGSENHTRLSPSHVDDMLGVTLDFCHYNHGKSAKMKKIQSTGLTY